MVMGNVSDMLFRPASKARSLGPALCLLVLLVSLTWAQAADYQTLINEGDAAFLKRADPKQAQLAVDKYRAAIKLDPSHAEGYWKLAMGCNWLGRISPKNRKVAIYQEGVDAGKKAVALGPDIPETHYWLGLDYGELGQASGVLKSLNLAGPIKKEMNTVLAMDPDFDSGGPHILLGRLYYKLPGIMGGDNKKAEEHLKAAIKLGPQRYIAYNFLAELYLDQGKREEALALLHKALTGPCLKLEEPNCQVWKGETKNILAKANQAQ